jgi:hypothetical protein
MSSTLRLQAPTAVKVVVPFLMMLMTQTLLISACTLLVAVPYLTLIYLLALVFELIEIKVPIRHLKAVLCLLIVLSLCSYYAGALCLLCLAPKVKSRILGSMTLVVVILELDQFIFNTAPWHL